MVIGFHENKKEDLVKYLKSEIEKGTRFSITLEEYTSLQNRRYMNINIHQER